MALKRRLNKTTTNSPTKRKTMKQVEHIDQEEGPTLVGTTPTNENEVAATNQPLNTTTKQRNGSHRPISQPEQFLQSEQTNNSDIEIENDAETSDSTNLEENPYDEEHTIPEREPEIKDPFAFDFTHLKVTQLLRPPKLILD
ncbi:unnamed protein product [Rotaria magnacalcarata]|uniref:Uncharacterized protein n=1 Tax=Rotaria magnacalcarata TaxID=392030 RepID=A0A815ZCQ7_9BILA|nr:unnamed protein product [Rotaria magnacalcarata]CAF1663564.1 unnamed protein product [Rotaria magnacalcarata]CAF3962896.1 unnamed protein product [Rotaria magnacalcarata]CAF3974558.1 unnamed protein product [Rotaria magnacalcarata]